MANIFKKEGNKIIEYRVIPQQVIPQQEVFVRRYTVEEFDAKISMLDFQSQADPKVIGDAIIANKKAQLDEILAAKTEMEKT